ncbi:hypothetical protein E2C01_069739 [Portunus trituberculatus]|uniref:Uncharacterized protein n=1 Tax=Portunus trituberculatus TaxID=210409 RepID=A0A5B7HZC8_PORTR|nr:hypothetical protein [Portunus trituberculatus]
MDGWEARRVNGRWVL